MKGLFCTMCENRHGWLWLLGLPFFWVRNNCCMSCRGFFGQDPSTCKHDGHFDLDNTCQQCGTLVLHADQLTPNHPRTLFLEAVSIIHTLSHTHRSEAEALHRILLRMYESTATSRDDTRPVV